MNAVNILGVRVDVIDRVELENQIAQMIRLGEKHYLGNVNIHAMNIAAQSKKYRTFLNNAKIVYCDGEGVRLGSRILGHKLPPRIVLTRWIWNLAEMCQNEGFSIFLLGGSEKSLNAALANMVTRCPRLRVAGHHGYFEKAGEASDRVIELLSRAKPDLLIVCFGMPVQENWVDDNFAAIDARVTIFGGSAIDYTAGLKKVAPPWMLQYGMEWLYRLGQEPFRLWKRYLLGNPLFVMRVLRQACRRNRVSD